MSKTLSITVSDEEYEEMRAAGAGASGLTPEAIIHRLIADHFGAASTESPVKVASEGTQNEHAKTNYRSAHNQFRAHLRNRGLLAEPQSLPTPPKAESLPPIGSTEYNRLEDEVTTEAGEAFLR